MKILKSISSWYLILAILIGIIYFGFAVWLPNLSFNFKLLFSSNLDASQKLSFFWGSFGAFCTNFTFFNQITVVTLSFLIGINISLLVLYIKKHGRSFSRAGLGIGATIISFLGLGCSACGSVVLTSLISIGTGTAGQALPSYIGKGVILLSILLVILSITLIITKLTKPPSCAIKLKK